MVTKTAPPLRETKAEAPVESRVCQHYWLIDPPETRVSNAECLLCGERRRFPNYLSDCLLENDKEKFDEWLARQSRRKPRRGNGDFSSEIEEGV